jgi:hypothetical protein
MIASASISAFLPRRGRAVLRKWREKPVDIPASTASTYEPSERIGK